MKKRIQKNINKTHKQNKLWIMRKNKKRFNKVSQILFKQLGIDLSTAVAMSQVTYARLSSCEEVFLIDNMVKDSNWTDFFGYEPKKDDLSNYDDFVYWYFLERNCGEPYIIKLISYAELFFDDEISVIKELSEQDAKKCEELMKKRVFQQWSFYK